MKSVSAPVRAPVSAAAEELRFEFSIAVLKLFYKGSIDVHKLKSECYSPSLREGALAESPFYLKWFMGMGCVINYL